MTDNPWYLEYKKNSQAVIRLFCFHHAGGGASSYHTWPEYLSSHIEMISIQLPGREGRFTEPLTHNLKEILSELNKGFVFYKEKPFLIFGHSLGGIIAFEFIKTLYQYYSLCPRHFIVSAAKAPHMPFRAKALSGLENKDLIEALKIYGDIDERILKSDEILNLILPIIRNDFSISERYHPSDLTPIPCDILHLSGTKDITVNQEEIQGWKIHTTGKFEQNSFPGNHFFIKDHRRAIIEIVNLLAEKYIKALN